MRAVITSSSFSTEPLEILSFRKSPVEVNSDELSLHTLQVTPARLLS